jgi:hypothetical protein
MGDDSDRRSAAVAYEYLGPEPEFVTISAFGHLFEDYPSGLAEDLITLEKEGAIYSHFALPGTERGDGSAEFGYYRIPFLPKEIFEYVEASLAFHQYQQARDAGASFDEALAALDNPEIADRVRRWGNYGKMKLKNGMVYDGRGCHASFYPPGMEALVCGARRDRYESLPELPAARDRLALVMQVLNNFSIAARILGKRQRNASPFEIVDEYDVQDLLFTVLRTVFEDARREEWTPQIAGSAKRMDIVIASLESVVEG